jgi:hypothetical protein
VLPVKRATGDAGLDEENLKNTQPFALRRIFRLFLQSFQKAG